jgi:6-phosphofructo-2-kinase
MVAATVSRNLKRQRSFEAAPPRSISSPPFEDFRKSVLSSEIQRPKVDMSAKLVIVMVGLPARGKSYVTKKVCRYLNWLQHDTKIFNVGNQRRKVAGRPLDSAVVGHCSDSAGGPPVLSENADHSASFFDPDNLQAGRLREQVAMETLGELLDYLLDEGESVAIFDATNSTIERRGLIVQRVKEKAGPKLSVLFLESQCFDEGICEVLD